MLCQHPGQRTDLQANNLQGRGIYEQVRIGKDNGLLVQSVQLQTEPYRAALIHMEIRVGGRPTARNRAYSRCQSATHRNGGSSIGRASAFQADCCGFESRPPLHFFSSTFNTCSLFGSLAEIYRPPHKQHCIMRASDSGRDLHSTRFYTPCSQSTTSLRCANSTICHTIM